ncbi:L-asparaginase [Hetaerina americana]|uniref:L-asparaginase n=1 Tax=Hetaerina americana TaxID=62018 RepID=UPI003A7F40E1
MNGSLGQHDTRNGRRRSSVDGIGFNPKSECSVLVIYSGGTIGMASKNGALEPKPNALGDYIRRCPFLHDEEYYKRRFGGRNESSVFVLPVTKGAQRRVIYTLEEYEPLLDSCNMNSDQWILIAENIKNSYKSYDGFVILHGTDTLAYSASALSFMFENLGKPVVLTGSQLSLFEPRSDGKDNFIESLVIAGNYPIPEVTICFGRKLLRGNRTTKMDAEGFSAFKSPNATPLATFGSLIEVKYHEIFRPTKIEEFKVHPILNSNVALLRIFPSITAQTVRAFLQSPIEGIVLQTYGSGNFPSNRLDILEAIENAIKQGIIVLNCSQCTRGSVTNDYQTGQVLSKIGVIAGGNMTPEASLTKLSYVLAKDWSIEKKKEMLQGNLRGELTVTKIDTKQIIKLMSMQKLKLDQFTASKVIIPALLFDAVDKENTDCIDQLIKNGGDLSQPNLDSRTPLHIACCKGKEKLVKFMLEKGASVHSKDRYGHTPLTDAVLNDHHEIITMLVNCGAHLLMDKELLGEKLCEAASHGDLMRLNSYKIAGGDLRQPDHSGRTALHMAMLHGHEECVRYLAQEGCDRTAKDIMGLTPEDYAARVGYQDLAALFDRNLTATDVDM